MEAVDRETLLRTLSESAREIGVPLSAAQCDACAVYADRLLETNRHTNLTRIVAPEEIAVKHFTDSLTVLVACRGIAEGASLADVGTGAGFPGLVLKIVRPDLKLTLLDSLAKRLRFLAEVVEALGLRNVDLVHARAEDAGREAAHRDRYDVVTARAVAGLPMLLEWCGPLVRPGGLFVAMKSARIDDELAAATGAASALGLRFQDDCRVTLPGTSRDDSADRRLLVYEKLVPTPARYPRSSVEINGKPLGTSGQT